MALGSFKRVAGVAAALALLCAPHARAAGTVTTVETTQTSVRKVVWSWLSTAGGVADGATTAAFDGRVIGLATIPSGGAAPDDNYDITITDAAGHDVLMGAGRDRDTANTEYVAEASLAGVASSRLTLNVSAAGAAKAGTVILYIR